MRASLVAPWCYSQVGPPVKKFRQIWEVDQVGKLLKKEPDIRSYIPLLRDFGQQEVAGVDLAKQSSLYIRTYTYRIYT